MADAILLGNGAAGGTFKINKSKEFPTTQYARMNNVTLPAVPSGWTRLFGEVTFDGKYTYSILYNNTTTSTKRCMVYDLNGTLVADNTAGTGSTDGIGATYPIIDYTNNRIIFATAQGTILYLHAISLLTFSYTIITLGKVYSGGVNASINYLWFDSTNLYYLETISSNSPVYSKYALVPTAGSSPIQTITGATGFSSYGRGIVINSSKTKLIGVNLVLGTTRQVTYSIHDIPSNTTTSSTLFITSFFPFSGSTLYQTTIIELADKIYIWFYSNTNSYIFVASSDFSSITASANLGLANMVRVNDDGIYVAYGGTNAGYFFAKDTLSASYFGHLQSPNSQYLEPWYSVERFNKETIVLGSGLASENTVATRQLTF